MKEPVRKSAYKRVIAGLLLLLMAIAPMASSLAAEYSTVINPYSKANVALRCDPGYDSKIIAYYPVGTKIELLEHGTWMRVRINGCTGYMHADFVNLKDYGTRPTKPSKEETMYVKTPNGNNLNLREQPSHDGRVISSYAPGTSVIVLLKGKTWHKVEVGGKIGYMSAAYLTSVKPVAPSKPTTPSKPNATVEINRNGLVKNPKANQRLNLREKPSLDAKVLGQYPNNVQVFVYSKTGDWYKVLVGEKIGYMMAKYVKVNAGPGAHSKFMTVVNYNGGSYVNLRDYAGMHYKVLRELKVGTKVEVLERGEYWTRVQAGNVSGYINNYFLK